MGFIYLFPFFARSRGIIQLSFVRQIDTGKNHGHFSTVVFWVQKDLSASNSLELYSSEIYKTNAAKKLFFFFRD